MTKSQRAWRDKKIKKIRVYKKIHNSILGGITGMMVVFFLLALCAMDNVNIYVIAGYFISFTWILIVVYANNLDHVEEGEE
jgi:hypothetical protein